MLCSISVYKGRCGLLVRLSSPLLGQTAHPGAQEVNMHPWPSFNSQGKDTLECLSLVYLCVRECRHGLHAHSAPIEEGMACGSQLSLNVRPEDRGKVVRAVSALPTEPFGDANYLFEPVSFWLLPAGRRAHTFQNDQCCPR